MFVPPVDTASLTERPVSKFTYLQENIQKDQNKQVETKLAPSKSSRILKQLTKSIPQVPEINPEPNYNNYFVRSTSVVKHETIKKEVYDQEQV